MKDLKRWLRLYDAKLNRFDVQRCLAEANLIRGDILEIFAQWREDDHENALRRKIALACLELLSELTWPLTPESEEKITVNHHRHAPYLQLARVDYKRAILQYDSTDLLRKMIAAGLPAMSVPRKERGARDEGIISLVLYVFRNIAMIAQPHYLPSNGDDNDISRAATIEAFNSQDVLQLLLTVSSSMGDDFVNQDTIVLETLFHLLKGVDPKKLFREDKQVMADNTKNFRSLLQKEKAMLAGQAKNAPTRHNRFGTMIWVKRDDDKLSTLSGQDVITSEEKTLQKMDKTKAWNKPRYKPKKVERPGESTDFVPVQLDAKTRNVLRTFVCDFLDSSFNPLFTHLRRAIESDSHRVRMYHSRQYFYLISWFLEAEEARRQAAEKPSPQKTSSDQPLVTEDTSFAYIAGVLTQENFVLLNRTMQVHLDDKSWSDVHACILAFTRTLLTVSAMAESPNEDDQEIAENIQSRIFYEETTHDRVVQILRGYKEGLQGFGYLDACTDMAHVFLRLLERYSKVNVDMHIRSKRRARKKAKAKAKATTQVEIEGMSQEQQVDADNDADDGQADEVEAHREVQERKFDFVRFAARFTNESCIDTFIHLANYYAELDLDQLKRCHRFFYRVAFKMEKVILLFRVDILSLFQRMIKGPNGLDTWLERGNEHFKEWEELVKQVFKKCIRKVQERPELMVEMLFNKIPNTLFYLENGFEKEVVRSMPRAPAELVVKAGMSLEDQLGVAVSVLVNQGKLDALIWVKNVLAAAVDERQAWEDQQEALASMEAPKAIVDEQETTADGDQQGNPQEEKPKPPSIVVVTDTNERRTATFKDKHLRLMLKTLSFQRLGATDDPDASWIVPSELTAQQLADSLNLIKKFEYDPPVYEDGRSAESFIRSESAAQRNRYEKDASDDEGDSEIDEGLFVPGGPTARVPDGDDERPKTKKRRLKRAGADDDTGISEAERKRRAEERRRREKEKDDKVKSTLFVTESDDEDDEERNAEFFRLEAERHGHMKGAIKEALMKERIGNSETSVGKNGKNKGKGKRKSMDSEARDKKKRRTVDIDSDDDDLLDDLESRAGSPMLISSRESSEAPDTPMRDSSDVEDGEQDDTPLSSQNKMGGEAGSVVEKQKQKYQQEQSDEEEDEDDAMPVARPARRSGGMPFIVDDDSD